MLPTQGTAQTAKESVSEAIDLDVPVPRQIDLGDDAGPRESAGTADVTDRELLTVLTKVADRLAGQESPQADHAVLGRLDSLTADVRQLGQQVQQLRQPESPRPPDLSMKNALGLLVPAPTSATQAVISFRVTPEDGQALERWAEAERCSLTELMHRALTNERHLEQRVDEGWELYLSKAGQKRRVHLRTPRRG